MGEGGALMMYDTDKWGSFANSEAMTAYIEESCLHLEMVTSFEPVEFNDEAIESDGRMFILLFRKVCVEKKDVACKTAEWLFKRAENLKDEGYRYFCGEGHLEKNEISKSSPRTRLVWKAIACYRQALDCVDLIDCGKSRDFTP